MLPSKEKLVVSREVGAVFDPQRGLAIPQREVGVRANMQLLKDLEITSFPASPTTGMKLRAQPRQQATPQPGNAEGLATTLSHLLMIWLTKTFLKIKQAMIQQNSTSVYPTSIIMPAPYPIIRKWIIEWNPLTPSSTFQPSSRTRMQMMRSKAGQMQKMRKSWVIAFDTFVLYTLYNLGRKRVQVQYMKAISSRGIRVFRIASLARDMPALLMRETKRHTRMNIPKNIQSPQKLFAKIASKTSAATSNTTPATQEPILSPFFSCYAVKCNMYIARGAFQSTHPQMMPIATPSVSLGSSGLNMTDAEVQRAASIVAAKVMVLQQQYEYCLLMAQVSMAQMPMLIPRAMAKASQCSRQPPMEGSSSLAGSRECAGGCSCWAGGGAELSGQFLIYISLGRLSPRQP